MSASHELGRAHSVESWKDGKLAGGLYGVSLGGAFFGESMFHRERDASKVALVHLVHRLRQRGFELPRHPGHHAASQAVRLRGYSGEEIPATAEIGD